MELVLGREAAHSGPALTAVSDDFEAIYREHAPRIFALACRMSGSREHAEDLLQEIFLQAYRKLDTFNGTSALGTWLYRLAVNHCVDFLRSRATKADRVTEPLNDTDSVSPVASMANPLTRIALDRAIAELPDGYRAAFVLHDVEGFEHNEVARLLGIAEGTSKSQVHKARMKLRALLTT